MNRELAVYDSDGVIQQRQLTPAETVQIATEIANRLSDIVEQKKLYKMIGDKKHLVAEAWETVIALDNAHPLIEWVEPIEAGGEIVAYKARAIVVKNGETIASGEMVCGLEEFPTQGKQGYAKHRAAMSAAETWAIAKAGRTKYAWIVTLADYAPTPAEEMQGTPASSPSKGEYWCAEHQTEWFKRGKMRHYAHPLGDGEPWCDMPSESKSKAPSKPKQADAPKDKHSDRGAFMSAAATELGLNSKAVCEVLGNQYQGEPFKSTSEIPFDEEAWGYLHYHVNNQPPSDGEQEALEL